MCQFEWRIRGGGGGGGGRIKLPKEQIQCRACVTGPGYIEPPRPAEAAGCTSYRVCSHVKDGYQMGCEQHKPDTDEYFGKTGKVCRECASNVQSRTLKCKYCEDEKELTVGSRDNVSTRLPM